MQPGIRNVVYDVYTSGHRYLRARNRRVIYELFGCGCQSELLRAEPFLPISPLAARHYSRERQRATTILEEGYFRLKTTVMQTHLV